jgi:hypothetical protein
VLLACVACTTTAKLNTFSELSNVGIAYVDAADAAIALAGEGSIAADTAILIENREAFEGDARRQALKLQSDLLRSQLSLLSDIRRHESLLKEYFVALGALADAGDADSAVGEAAGGTITTLGKLSTKLASVKVGEVSVSDFAAQATPLLVASLRSRALEKELRKNGAAFNRELLVSEHLMAFLADKIRADDAVVQGRREADLVFGPYVKDGPLPGDWPAQRTAYLTRSVDLAAVNSAQDAARKLRTALASAAEGHLAPGQLQLLVSDLNAIVDVLERVKGTP